MTNCLFVVESLGGSAITLDTRCFSTRANIAVQEQARFGTTRVLEISVVVYDS